MHCGMSCFNRKVSKSNMNNLTIEYSQKAMASNSNIILGTGCFLVDGIIVSFIESPYLTKRICDNRLAYFRGLNLKMKYLSEISLKLYQTY